MVTETNEETDHFCFVKGSKEKKHRLPCYHPAFGDPKGTADYYMGQKITEAYFVYFDCSGTLGDRHKNQYKYGYCL
jgi:hypothetical protein